MAKNLVFIKLGTTKYLCLANDISSKILVCVAVVFKEKRAVLEKWRFVAIQDKGSELQTKYRTSKRTDFVFRFPIL